MKKTSIILSVVATLLVAAAFALFFVPQISPYMPYGFASSGLGYWLVSRLEFFKFAAFANTYGQYPIMWAFLVVALLVVAIWVVHLIAMIKRCRRNLTLVNVAWLIAGLLSVDLLVYGFLPGLWATRSVSSAGFASLFEGGSFGPEFLNVLTLLKFQNANVLTYAFSLIPYLLGASGFVLLIISLILSFADMKKNPGAIKKKSLVPSEAEPKAEANPAPVAQTKPTDEEQYRQTLNEELAENPVENNTTVTGQTYQGPQPGIIQYINYGGKAGKPMDNGSYITKDDLGKIIHEELSEYLSKEATKADDGAGSNMLTSDDLRQIIREEMGVNKPVGVAVAPQEGMKASEIRQLIAEEIAKALAAEREAAVRIDEDREAKRQAALAEENLARETAEKTRDARLEALIAQIRASNAELAAMKGSSLRIEEYRTIVSQELDRKFPLGVVAAQIAPAPVAPVVVAPLAALAPVVAAPLVQVAPAPIAPAPVAPVVVATVAPAAPAAPAPLPETPKIIRIPFATRMTNGEKELKSHYNELKAEALSYGLKSRISNSGDTFRLHTKSYLKISIAGKGLKIYYAIDPKDYANGPIPVKDASNKNIYKEIPGCFKVKSDLSLKRAKQLIADACGKDKLTQEPVEIQNFAAELKDYKPQGADDDEDEGDDEN